MAERIDNFDADPFIDSPADFLVKTIVAKIKAVPQFKLIFGDVIDPYKRMDYSIRELPALRVYNNTYVKEYESWFINGDVMLDVILPASLRRNDLQQIQDVISGALLQQFRRPTYFAEMEVEVPGLNELGKRFSVDKSLGFEWGEEIVPLTQTVVNFRLDLRKWDDYLESDNRTKDAPFERTLGNLERLVGTIQGLRDDQETVEVSVGVEQKGLEEG